MASQPNSQSHAGHGKRTSFSAFPGGNASIILEKSKTGIRGSTPDSEALASSDDEQDQHHRLHSVTNNFGPKSTRRPSWLTEVQPAPQRKGSVGGNGTFSPASPHAATASGDQMPWGVNSPVGVRGHSNSNSFPWGSAIWNNDSQKGPPLRLTEVLPSPTSMGHPVGFYAEEPLLSPPIGRDNATESSIPFAIPLHPTLKTYRSQSYSVGQLDPELMNAASPNHGGPLFHGRARGGTPYAGLQHRPSRPSMLSELSHDGLGQLREVEDDDESSNGSVSGVQLSNTQARTIEQLAMENAILRQAAADQMENTKLRNRAATATSQNSAPRTSIHQRLQESVPEETDYTLYEIDDWTGKHYNYEGYSATGVPENRTVESVKKGHWQSSLGFGGLGEPPQSRRHSFADVPTRQTSISSNGESQSGFATAEHGLSTGGRLGSPAGYNDGLARPSQGDSGEYAHFRSYHVVQEKELELEHLHDRNFAASYFSGMDASLLSGEVHRSSMSPATSSQAYTTHAHYGRSQHSGQSQPRQNQLLYVVTFKACRADVFYVQEGTGLHVKSGDLVIVEADRGTDLGTVAQENITWAKAKELREHYIEEHYRWLMMFSRHGQNGTAAGPNPNGQAMAPHGAQANTNGGMGGPTGQQDMPNAELKPKMIKRLAQAHEIQTLRDKEGNEAKAKRVCQQKVVDHRLNMEILDAEFQMDWKKLTFYYFADAYINFNPLVTDLFKIYKTRIWMSAINPASFVTPAAGLQMPLGLGPGAFNAESDHYTDRRQQRHSQNFPAAGSNPMALGSLDRIWDPNQDNNANLSIPLPHVYAHTLQHHELDTRQLDQLSAEHHHSGLQAHTLQPRFSSNGYSNPDLHHSYIPENSNGGTRKSHVLGNEWSHAFQGLSLGS